MQQTHWYTGGSADPNPVSTAPSHSSVCLPLSVSFSENHFRISRRKTGKETDERKGTQCVCVHTCACVCTHVCMGQVYSGEPLRKEGRAGQVRSYGGQQGSNGPCCCGCSPHPCARRLTHYTTPIHPTKHVYPKPQPPHTNQQQPPHYT